MDRPGQRIRVRVGEAAIDAGALAAEVSRPDSGATVVFLGTVREGSAVASGVTHLDYEVYAERVEAVIEEIVAEAAEKWPLLSVVVEHRSGKVVLTEASVGIAVSAAHRDDAFEAARYLIDEVKGRAPIWKKEHWPGGSAWSEGS